MGANTTQLQAEIERLERLLAWWQQQATAVGRDAERLPHLLTVGSALALGALMFSWLAALGIAAVAALAYTQGSYLNVMHRLTYRDHIRQTEQDLWRAHGELSARARPRGRPDAGRGLVLGQALHGARGRLGPLTTTTTTPTTTRPQA